MKQAVLVRANYAPKNQPFDEDDEMEYSHLVANNDGIIEQTLGIKLLVRLAWTIIYTALWNGIVFTEEEKEAAKMTIRRILLRETNSLKAYLEFVQRVILARHYYNDRHSTHIPHSAKWLREEEGTVYYMTRDWYAGLCENREVEPMFKDELRLFGMAILEVSRDRQRKRFHYWRNYFLEHKKSRMFNLFLSTVINCQNPW